MRLTSLTLIAALSLWAAAANAGLPEPGAPGAPKDSRYCGEPNRGADGKINRSAAQRARFVAVWPKPMDGNEWHVDHVIPLVNGGCDLPHNMQWLPYPIKGCDQPLCKDRWERRVYKTPRLP